MKIDHTEIVHTAIVHKEVISTNPLSPLLAKIDGQRILSGNFQKDDSSIQAQRLAPEEDIFIEDL